MAIWLATTALALAAIFSALLFGSTDFSPGQLWQAVRGDDDGIARRIVVELRLPRALAAFATGALLAMAGALMQVLLRNPLADPYTLGISGGAAAGALGAMLVGSTAGMSMAGAFGGALLSVGLVFALARRDLGRGAPAGSAEGASALLLVGVMVASAWSALLALILTLAPDPALRGMLFWLTGDLGGAEDYGAGLAVAALVLLACVALGRSVNLLLAGDVAAYALGVDVRRLRRAIYLLASAATAAAVTTAGAIGFVGLVVPHALRLLVGNDQRVLLPACAFGGGALLVLADTVARVAFAPLQLPVGVVMGAIGAPTFIWLLAHRRT